jgi:Na+-transporting NADH:ubiquinone oxidoreductase subunit C
MRSNSYVITFVVIMTVIVALVLSLMSTVLRPLHEKNEAIFNKKAILAAIESDLGDNVKAANLADDEVLNIFDGKIKQIVVDYNGNEVSAEEVEAKGYVGGKAENVDMAKEKKKPEAERIYPLFIYDADQGTYYIVSVRGSGLWDEIWGNIALKDDFSTIVGASFDHKGETPGLGAEIKDNPAFKNQFAGKSIYDANGAYTSVVVRKGGIRNDRYEVDAISGATVTSVGVSDMLFKGINYYMPYFETLKKS